LDFRLPRKIKIATGRKILPARARDWRRFFKPHNNAPTPPAPLAATPPAPLPAPDAPPAFFRKFKVAFRIFFRAKFFAFFFAKISAKFSCTPVDTPL
jgi:hypothetical protein